MRVAIVVPYLVRLFGSKAALSMARALAKDHEVVVYVHAVNNSILGDVKEKIGKAQLSFYRTSGKTKFGKLFALKYQVLKGVDRAIGRRIIKDHERIPFDLVLVMSNEGRSMAQILSKLPKSKRPITGVVIMELHDHGFHLYHERSYSAIRLLLWPLYPLIHLMERLRFRAFDVVLSNSKWTGSIFEYLYGINVLMAVPTVDYGFFSATKFAEDEEPYIAFPTVSLTTDQAEIGQRLVEDGVRLISYGPKQIRGIQHMGFIPDAEMPQFIANASAMLFLFDYEALGLVPLESLAAGTPVITLPKQGPLSELSSMSNVRYADTYETIKKCCLEYTMKPKDKATFDSCKEYGFKLSAEVSGRKLMKKIEELKNS